MHMDDPIETQKCLAMAKALFRALRGKEVDRATRQQAADYSNKLFVTPWRDETDAETQAYAQRFFAALTNMGDATSTVARWRHSFDQHDIPKSMQQAQDFISEVMRLLLHYPRDHHSFVCQRRDIRLNGVLDFPVEHPISVEFWALYITLAGSATLTVGTEQRHLGPHSIAIIAPGCKCTLTRSENAEHWSYDWLSFRSRMEWIELLDWATELTRPVAFSVTDGADFSSLTQQTERLESTTYLPGTLSERLCNNIIENILLSISIIKADTSGDEARVNPKVRDAVNFILQNYSNEITLGMIANSVSISPVRLSTLFREHFGISVIKWRDQLRLQKARELLIHSHDSIGKIANRIGYQDPLYFSRRFKAHFGEAPTRLRASQTELPAPSQGLLGAP